MAFEYTVLREEKLILVRFEGVASMAELLASAAIICSDPRYIRGADGIIDLTRVSPGVTPENIKALVEYTLSKKKHGHGRWAVVATTPIATALTMLYQRGISSEHPFTLFYTIEGAAAFLGHQFDEASFHAALTA